MIDTPNLEKRHPSRWKVLVCAGFIYVLLEMVLYKMLGVVLSANVLANVNTVPTYLDWAFYFYFPEKKQKFYYFLMFLGTTWIYFFVVDLYLNFWIRRCVSPAGE